MKKTFVEHLVEVHALFKRFFPRNRCDEVWGEWLYIEPREYYHLFDLLRSEVGAAFKARAITILLTPAFSSIPFSWPEPIGWKCNYLERVSQAFPPHRIEVADLPSTLRLYMAELICLHVDLIRNYYDDDDVYISWFAYNRYATHLLGILPRSHPLAAELFRRFEISDPLPNSKGASTFSYESFQALLHEPNVPEQWKQAADSQMREKIKTRTDTRNLWNLENREEHPLYGYQLTIVDGFKYGKLIYSPSLLASQIEFLLGLELPRTSPLFKGNELLRIFEALGKTCYKNLRHRLARYVVLEIDWTRYPLVRNHKDKEVAEYMLRAFHFDKELTARLKALLAEGKTQMDEEARKKMEEAVRRDDVLARMR